MSLEEKIYKILEEKRRRNCGKCSLQNLGVCKEIICPKCGHRIFHDKNVIVLKCPKCKTPLNWEEES